MNGKLEKDKKNPWDGKLYLGTLWCLQQFCDISASAISEFIKWEPKKVRDELRRITEDSMLTYFIESRHDEKNIKLYTLNRGFKNTDLETLANLGRMFYERGSKHNKIKEEKNNKLKPTKPEIIIKQILEKIPNNFIFNDYYGNKNKLKIGGKNPDFIDVNNKLIIEHFGDHWHGPKIRVKNGDYSTNKEHEEEKILFYAKFGYKTLIIWENELRNIELVKNKIDNFIAGKNNAI